MEQEDKKSGFEPTLLNITLLKFKKFTLWLIKSIKVNAPIIASKLLSITRGLIKTFVKLCKNAPLNIKTKLFLAKKQKLLDKLPPEEVKKPLLWDDQPSSKAAKELSIKLRMPILPRMSKSQLKIAISALVFAALFTVGAFVLIGGKDANHNSATTKVLGTGIGAGSNGGVVGQVDTSLKATSCPNADENPKFKLLFPQGKKADDFGGACRTSPLTSVAVFTYIDKIGNNGIKVNQQQLPEQLNTDAKLKAFAQDNYLNDSFEVDGTKVYAGLSIKGPQTLIFTKNNLLVFIVADTKENQSVWVKYIASLK